MPPTEAIPDPLRRAALVLHAMAPADRAWMLDRVDPVHRSPLGALLAELKALGFPADRALLEESIAATMSGSARGAPHPAADGVAAAVARLGAEEAYRRLAPEPDTLVAIVLAAGPWSWEAAVLSRLGPARAAAVRALVASRGGSTEALREAVMSALARPGSLA